MERRLIVANPHSGTAEKFTELKEFLKTHPQYTLKEMQSSDETSAISERANAEGFDTVIAAGGDGTVNAVINGLALQKGKKSRLGIFPLGTGNDLCRTLGIPLEITEAFEFLENRSQLKAFDLIQMSYEGKKVFGGNAASGGFSGQVEEALTDELKSTWGPLSYLRAAASVVPNLKDYQTSISFDGEPPVNISLLNLIVANGKYAAKGMEIAPQANPFDGWLDVVGITYAPLLDLAKVAARLVGGDYTEAEEVFHKRAKKIHITSQPGMWFSLDGELLTKSEVEFEILPQAIEVLLPA